MAITYLKVKSAKCILFTSGGLGLGLGLVSSGLGLTVLVLLYGLGLKNLVFFTSLATTFE